MAETDRKPKIYPLAWLLMALVALFCLHRWLPLGTLIPAPFNRLGWVLTIPGLAMVLYSGATFIKVKTGLLPFTTATQLVTGGFYRFTRNPMYLGMVAFLLGLAIFLGTIVAFLPVVIFGWIIDRQFIRNEEKFLIEAFGDEYQNYMQRVRRWI